MVQIILGQEVGKDFYGKNTTASEFEQGVVPGLFFGSVAGNGAKEALTRTICKWIKKKGPTHSDTLDEPETPDEPQPRRRLEPS
jgi:hypothetical protein